MPGRRALALLVGACSLVNGCGPRGAAPAAAGSRPLAHVVFQTDWYACPEHGGYYQALLKGYYREAGLDVEIDQGGPGGFAMQKLVVGQAQFIMGGADDAARAVDRGLPVAIVGAQLEHDPQAVFVHEESPVRSLRDLDGRNVRAVIGTSWTEYVKRHFGISFTTTPVDYGQAAFVSDPAAIQQGYMTSDAYTYLQRHVAVRMLPLSDAGYDPYRVIVARRSFIAGHPGIVRAFLAASVRGWEDFLSGDATETVAQIARLNPMDPVGYCEYARAQMRRFGFVSGRGPGESTGLIRPDRLQAQLDLLRSLGLLSRPLTVADVCVLDPLPGPG